MSYQAFREEMTGYYFNRADENAENFLQSTLPLMDERYSDGMSAFEMKAMQ